MPKLVWNGGFEMDWKTVGAILGFAFIAGGNWIQYRELRAAFVSHVAEAKLGFETLSMHGYRLGSLETRIDFCCPLYHSEGPAPKILTPKDIIVPPVAKEVTP